MLTGTARTEEESSLVGEADLHSNLLPAGEKVRTSLAIKQGVGAQGWAKNTLPASEKVQVLPLL